VTCPAIRPAVCPKVALSEDSAIMVIRIVLGMKPSLFWGS
jgi:hypothetical protein